MYMAKNRQQSLGFSEFRQLLDLWDHNLNKQKIESFIDTNDLVIFFKKDEQIYAGGEDARMMFARLKSPEDKSDSDSGFTALNFAEAVKGNNVQQVFSAKDLPNIEIISQEDAIDSIT